MPLMASPHFTPEMQRGPHGTSPTEPSGRSTSKTNGPGPSVPGIKGRIGPQKVSLVARYLQSAGATVPGLGCCVFVLHMLIQFSASATRGRRML